MLFFIYKSYPQNLYNKCTKESGHTVLYSARMRGQFFSNNNHASHNNKQDGLNINQAFAIWADIINVLANPLVSCRSCTSCVLSAYCYCSRFTIIYFSLIPDGAWLKKHACIAAHVWSFTHVSNIINYLYLLFSGLDTLYDKLEHVSLTDVLNGEWLTLRPPAHWPKIRAKSM